MDHTVIWVISGISAAFLGLTGILFGMITKVGNKQEKSSLLLAKLESLPELVEKIDDKVDKLSISVGIIRNGCLYVPHDSRKAED